MFSWFKRKSNSPTPRKRRLPERRLAPVEEIVEQGLLVTDVAARMTVKNAIILNALGRKADFNLDEVVGMVRDTLLELADERDDDARHIAQMRSEIRRLGTSSWSENDYGSDDNKTLRHRQEVYESIAVELRARAEDDAYLQQTAERARTAAWAEVGDSLQRTASHPYYAGGSSEEYQQARDERIQLLIQRDLTDLIKQQSGR